MPVEIDVSISPPPFRRFAGRKIVVAVTGGIAAFKTCYLVRELRREGAEVQVIMSRAGAEFVTSLTFATISGRPVLTEMFPSPPPTDPIHLSPAAWGDALIIAPATADFIGKLANGLADDIPSTVAMAFQGPILIAPAMNPKMWSAPAVVENMVKLRRRGVNVVGPATGEMGGIHEEPGVGRMSEPVEILDQLEEILGAKPDWQGRRVLVTSGPTQEAIDPVRFISNRSSGRMGDAVARAAKVRGAEVFLVRGKGATGTPPSGVILVEVETAAEMFEAVTAIFPQVDLAVIVAAVADWRPAAPAGNKIKKSGSLADIQWVKTDDILGWAGQTRKHQALIGFALETTDHLAFAKDKLRSKQADLIVLNDATRADSAFGGDTTRLTLLANDAAPVEFELETKRKAAERLLDEAAKFLPA